MVHCDDSGRARRPDLTRPDHNPGPAGTRIMATFQNTTATPDSQVALQGTYQ